MTLEEAIQTLCEMYGKAVTYDYVQKPVSWALYQTWKISDNKEKPKTIEERREQCK